MKISDNGVELIKKFEGCKLTAYPDSGTGGAPWTIGYGWTHSVNGLPVQAGMIISQTIAEELLQRGIAQVEKYVNQLLHVSVNQNQFDALVSFAYNVGKTKFANSTLLKLINERNFDGAATQFSYWNKAGSNVLPGLIYRRAAERECFIS
jgi:lysozyme